jgi:hypothetical protein
LYDIASRYSRVLGLKFVPRWVRWHRRRYGDDDAAAVGRQAPPVDGSSTPLDRVPPKRDDGEPLDRERRVAERLAVVQTVTHLTGDIRQDS